METVDLETAAATIAELADRAGRGEEIIIAKDGRPLARLVALATPAPVAANPKPREFGFLTGKVWMADNFDDPMDDEFMRAFEGG